MAEFVSIGNGDKRTRLGRNGRRAGALILASALAASGSGCGTMFNNNGNPNGVIGKNSAHSAANAAPISKCTANTDNTENVYNYLKNHVSIGSDAVNRAGYAGFIGNWKVESDGCLSTNPQGFSDNGAAHGFAQWEGGRWDALQAYARRHGGNWYDLNIQEGFAAAEINEDHGGILEDLQRTTDPAKAADYVQQDFEGCSVCHQDRRESEARAEYAKH